MERIGLISQPFETSIHGFSLKFKDPELESRYLEGQVSLRYVNSGAKHFLLLILLGHGAVAILDIVAAAGVNPDYHFSLETWIVYSMLLVIAIMEITFYFYSSLSECRGLALTIIGGFALFHDNYDTFNSDQFYPSIGEEYFLGLC